jgi:hypothetical protein
MGERLQFIDTRDLLFAGIQLHGAKECLRHRRPKNLKRLSLLSGYKSHNISWL